MQTANQGRAAILTAVRNNIPERRVDHPGIPFFDRAGLDRAETSLKADFEKHLVEAGGQAHEVQNGSQATDRLASLHPQAKVICSAVQEIAGTRRIEQARNPHELADVDVGIVRAQFGVAETGAVWLTQEDLVWDALAFLSQHLIVLLDPREIVRDMHEAYRRVRLDLTAYGCFMMGPSATADVEATLVHGAQGARSLNVFYLPRS